jgi:hypothetical protein
LSDHTGPESKFFEEIKMKAFVVFMCLILCAGIVFAGGQQEQGKVALREITSGEVNTPPPSETDLYYYPRNFADVYEASPAELIGQVVAIYIDPTQSDKEPTMVPLSLAITKDGVAAIKTVDQTKEQPVYSSIVNGSVALNFAAAIVGSASLSASAVYNLSLTKISTVSIPPSTDYINKPVLLEALKNLPDKYVEIFFVTGIQNRLLAYSTYYEATSAANANIGAINISGKVYYSDQKLNTQSFLCFAGIRLGNQVGTYDPASRMYIKKSPEELAKIFTSSEKPQTVGAILPPENYLDALRPFHYKARF